MELTSTLLYQPEGFIALQYFGALFWKNDSAMEYRKTKRCYEVVYVVLTAYCVLDSKSASSSVRSSV